MCEMTPDLSSSTTHLAGEPLKKSSRRQGCIQMLVSLIMEGYCSIFAWRKANSAWYASDLMKRRSAFIWQNLRNDKCLMILKCNLERLVIKTDMVFNSVHSRRLCRSLGDLMVAMASRPSAGRCPLRCST